jgi:RNA recognition motif-containing protein
MIITTSRFNSTPRTEILRAASRVLSESFKSKSKFPKNRKGSLLYDFHVDLNEWLNKFPVEKRNEVYDYWMKTRKLNPDRIRNSVLIHNIPADITCADIYLICSAIGKVLDVYKPTNDKNYMFVDFEDALCVPNAIKELHQLNLNGHTLCADIPKTAFTTRRKDITK